jgi:hypothetical protein
VLRLPDDEQLISFRGMHPVRSWRPPYWVAFSALPDFTLKEVLGTIGRKPKNAAERERFLAWRGRSLLMQPEAPPAALALPGPVTVAPPESFWTNKRIGAVVASLALVFLYWLFRPVAPDAPPTKAQPHVNVPPPEPDPPLPFKLTRTALPDRNSVMAVPPTQATRDYLISVIRANLNLCAPGHGAGEAKAVGELFSFIALRANQPQPGDFNGPRWEAQRGVMAAYRKKPVWTREDRENIVAMMLLEGHATGNIVTEPSWVMDRFYAGGNCPFDAVAEKDYIPPSYATLAPAAMMAPPLDQIEPDRLVVERVVALIDNFDSCPEKTAGVSLSRFSLACATMAKDGTGFVSRLPPKNVQTLEECADYCRATPRCAAFTYWMHSDPGGQFCGLYAPGYNLYREAKGWVTGTR